MGGPAHGLLLSQGSPIAGSPPAITVVVVCIGTPGVQGGVLANPAAGGGGGTFLP